MTVPDEDVVHEPKPADRNDVETQTEGLCASRTSTSDTSTQTTEFEYLFKETRIQPFTQEYFAQSDDKVLFYTGLPSFYTRQFC